MAAPDGLTLDDDMRFQRREWRVQRIGWVVMALFLVTALLGLLGGPGPLSSTTASSVDGRLGIEFHRFERRHRDTQWIIRAKPAGQGGTFTVSINQEFVGTLNLRDVVPQPVKVETGGGMQHYTFAMADRSQPLVVTLSGESERMGMARGEVRMEGAAAEFWQWVYP